MERNDQAMLFFSVTTTNTRKYLAIQVSPFIEFPGVAYINKRSVLIDGNVPRNMAASRADVAWLVNRGALLGRRILRT